MHNIGKVNNVDHEDEKREEGLPRARGSSREEEHPEGESKELCELRNRCKRVELVAHVGADLKLQRQRDHGHQDPGIDLYFDSDGLEVDSSNRKNDCVYIIFSALSTKGCWNNE